VRRFFPYVFGLAVAMAGCDCAPQSHTQSDGGSDAGAFDATVDAYVDAAVDAAPPDASTQDAFVSCETARLDAGTSPVCATGYAVEGTPVDASGLLWPVRAPGGLLWIRDDDLSVPGGPYSVVRLSSSGESLETIGPVVGLPFNVGGREYGRIAEATAYLADSDRWLFLVQPADADDASTYAVVYARDGRPRSAPVELAPFRTQGPVATNCDGFVVLVLAFDDARRGDSTRHVAITADGEIAARSDAFAADGFRAVSGWQGDHWIVASCGSCASDDARTFALFDLLPDGSLVRPRTLSALGEGPLLPGSSVMELELGLLLYMLDDRRSVRAQRFDPDTGTPTVGPSTVFTATSSGSFLELGHRGAAEPGRGFAWPVLEVEGPTSHESVMRFTDDTRTVQNVSVLRGLAVTPLDSTIWWLGDRFLIRSFLGSDVLDEMTCRP